MNAAKQYSDKAPGRHPDDAHIGKRPDSLGEASLSKSQGLNKSQSEGALRDKKKAKRSYGGTVVGGKFVRANAGTIDELTEADKQEILQDLEKKKQEQELIL